MYIDHNNKLVFIHVSRTGGSSIKTALNLHEKKYTEHHHLDSSYIPKECKDYFKFAFVRNPFDRFVSLYHFRPKGLSFSDWLDNITLTYVQQVDYGLDKLDFVGRYENLQDDFDKFCKKINFEKRINLGSLYKKHNSGINYDNLVKLSEVSRKNLLMYLENDYKIYNYLIANKDKINNSY